MRLATGAALLALAISAQAGTAPPGLQIADAEAYSRKCGGKALLVLRRGATIHESYTKGGAPDWRVPVMSLTKNLTALAILAARADGLLELDEPTAKTLPEWRGARGHITIRELLQQTSGLAAGYEAIYARGVRDKNRVALGLPLVAEPGTLFDYAPSNYEVLGEILRRKLKPRGLAPLAYLEAKVLRPLGIAAPANWRRDRAGNPYFSAGARLTAREVAKIGEFVRTRGRVWLLPVLPASAFDGAFTGSSANAMYGYGLWLNAQAARGAVPISIEGTLGVERPAAEWRRSCLASAAPADLFAMVGSGGLRCYVAPSQKLVVVRFGDGRGFSDAEFLRRLFGRR
jgi:CubicO group peptidase (beta-lactamase class C family)